MQLRQICDRPLIFICPNFMTSEECDAMIQLGRTFTHVLPIPTPPSGEQGEVSRRLGGMFPLNRTHSLPAALTALVHTTAQRAAHLTGVPSHSDEGGLYLTGTRPNDSSFDLSATASDAQPRSIIQYQIDLFMQGSF